MPHSLPLLLFNALKSKARACCGGFKQHGHHLRLTVVATDATHATIDAFGLKLLGSPSPLLPLLRLYTSFTSLDDFRGWDLVGPFLEQQ